MHSPGLAAADLIISQIQFIQTVRKAIQCLQIGPGKTSATAGHVGPIVVLSFMGYQDLRKWTHRKISVYPHEMPLGSVTGVLAPRRVDCPNAFPKILSSRRIAEDVLAQAGLTVGLSPGSQLRLFLAASGADSARLLHGQQHRILLLFHLMPDFLQHGGQLHTHPVRH